MFTHLRFPGFKYRLCNSSFCQKEVLYLGYVISQDGMTVAPHNVKKIVNVPIPKDKTGVRRLLGLFGFYQSFKGFSKIAALLFKLINKDTAFQWTEQCQQATYKLKSCLTYAPTLVILDFYRKLILTADASSITVGDILSQVWDNGKDHLTAFYSKALSTDERKWDSCDQELFAILSGIKHFWHYLLNTKFLVRTDNKACTYVLKLSQQLAH